jgi:hypothetical protein
MTNLNFAAAVALLVNQLGVSAEKARDFVKTETQIANGAFEAFKAAVTAAIKSAYAEGVTVDEIHELLDCELDIDEIHELLDCELDIDEIVNPTPEPEPEEAASEASDPLSIMKGVLAEPSRFSHRKVSTLAKKANIDAWTAESLLRGDNAVKVSRSRSLGGVAVARLR